MGGEAREPAAGHLPRGHHRDGDRRRRLHPAGGGLHRRARPGATSCTAGRTRSARATSARTPRSRSRPAPAGWRPAATSTRSISPAGTGLVYSATSARLSYALGQEEALPDQARRRLNKKRRAARLDHAWRSSSASRVPAVPELAVAGRSGHLGDGDHVRVRAGLAARAAPARPRARPRRTGCRPAGARARSAFVSANLIIYWSASRRSGSSALASVLGLIVFAITRATRPTAERVALNWKASAWVWPWIGGMIVIGGLGRYGGNNTIPEWWDIGLVIVFSLAIYVLAVRSPSAARTSTPRSRPSRPRSAAEPELNIAD